MTWSVSSFHLLDAEDERGQAWRRELLDMGYDLWMDALGDSWPLDRDMFYRHAESGAMAMENGRALGLVLHERTPEKGAIKAIVVHPDFRRQGVGTILMRRAMRSLRWQGRQTYRVWPAPPYMLLGGGYRYIWPGIPEDLSDSKGFFDAVLGWPYSEPSYDMIMPLHDFSPPPGCYQRPAAGGITFRSATVDDMPRVLAFEEREFPGWVRYMREHAPEDIVIGVDSAGVVVASLLFDMPPILWSRLLGGGAAEIGAVGVAESRRNLGVGTALVARACQILRDRGVETAVLRWLYRVDFYRRIGFRVWKQYIMSSKTLDYVSAPYGAPRS